MSHELGARLTIKKPTGTRTCQTPGCSKLNPPNRFHHDDECEEVAWRIAHKEPKPLFIQGLLVSNSKTTAL